MHATSTQIVTQAPTWVWFLLTGLLAIGLMQARDRLVSLRLATVLPLVMLVLSFRAVVSTFVPSADNVMAWFMGVVVAVAVTHLSGWPRGIEWDARHQRIAVPGSWVPLMLFLAIFALKFAVGAAMATHAAITGDPAFAPAVALAYGAFSGIFLRRGIAMWRAVPSRIGRLQPTA
ncbi:DUF6622 family protein [Piscinibacter gummiphilus]|uniref:Uncharacterized protein n=1 Tax=Piscinibacter gummiphilus TaxID=946333 RepID=A0A1W6LAW1_9BURK|nr:DUF6622 family protein [Piscinibacter gummiphilus]ARN21425.1 hypothetical protein A4W93_16805 [Piscinibacter gummiphilus]ATU66104.1 hypothetical protein CPZ87_16885 [Piscinibacter gummiphilus]GLS96225.1 hypothetical protein GCM10007918_35170 [Piscinibacter gummiphilus]